MNGRGGAGVLCGRWSQHGWAAVRMGWFVEVPELDSGGLGGRWCHPLRQKIEVGT